MKDDTICFDSLGRHLLGFPALGSILGKVGLVIACPLSSVVYALLDGPIRVEVVKVGRNFAGRWGSPLAGYTSVGCELEVIRISTVNEGEAATELTRSMPSTTWTRGMDLSPPFHLLY